MPKGGVSMFVSKKEHEALKKQVEELKKLNNELWQGYVFLKQEIDEIKKPKKENYFG